MEVKGKLYDDGFPSLEELKEHGNFLFRRCDFCGAADVYSTAIQFAAVHSHSTHTLPSLYCNRSAAQFNLRRFELAVEDAEHAIALRSTWTKPYYRRGQAYEGLNEFEKARVSYDDGLRVDPNDTLLLRAKSELTSFLRNLQRQRVKLEPKLSKDSKQFQRFTRFVDWLKRNGAYLPKLQLDTNTVKLSDKRCVYACESISVNEIIFELPLDLILTTEVAMSTSIGIELAQSEAKTMNRHIYLALFLLQERFDRNLSTGSHWSAYIDVLPRHFRHLPLNWHKNELDLLSDTYCLKKIRERVQALDEEFSYLQQHVKSLNRFTFEQFCWARNVISSRVFGIVVDSYKTEALVPLADMLKHQVQRQSRWVFNDTTKTFKIFSSQSFHAGEEITLNYGRKCNSRYLINYGFSLVENLDNEALVELTIDAKDPKFREKQSMLFSLIDPTRIDSDQSISIPIIALPDHDSARICISIARIIASSPVEFQKISHLYDLLIQQFPIDEKSSENIDIEASKLEILKSIPSLSIRNEVRALRQMKVSVKRVLDRFDSSIRDDLDVLCELDFATRTRGDKEEGENEENSNFVASPFTQSILLSKGVQIDNAVNALRVRVGEKRVLRYVFDLVHDVLPLLALSWKDLQPILKMCKDRPQITPYARYVINAIAPLIRCETSSSNSGLSAAEEREDNQSKLQGGSSIHISFHQ